jgi:hypothetical protein
MADDKSISAAQRGNPHATIDHVSVAPTPSGDKLAVIIALTVEIDDATVLDLITQAIGAFARKSGVDR